MNDKFFISYSDHDKNKLDALTKALKKTSKKFQPIIIAKRKFPGKPLTDKVKEGILETPHFIPILTRASIANQWVNQEIGFAIANERNIIPVVEKRIIHQLKGFIHNQIDLPFTFEGYKSNNRKEAQSFRNCYKELIQHLENEIVEPTFISSITPRQVRQGDDYTTKVHFIGKVKHAFFDNYVKHISSGWYTWNWDPSTLTNGAPTTPGKLQAAIDKTSEYSNSTAGWPIGKYEIYTRVYEHPKPGETRRYILFENKHNLKVIKNA